MVSLESLLDSLGIRSLKDLATNLEEAYKEEKNRECEQLYNKIVDVLIEEKATIQNTLFVLKMVEFGYLRAKYLELVEGAIKIPKDSVPIPKTK